ncbi:hypothetical protein LRH25_31675 [Ideonella azotifigens]|uniref:Uncharacterized protein n=1 Tax=Ideonella azotifigens TaxID=513160 RepID=A0ABP3VBD0_9BURK|nr:hypothetical protein [Ideonella azotifigens]MCD2344886.1 hypothetical protein [Ideonella azotifigens]
MPASTPNLAAAQRIAERFAALTDAQRRAAYAKMQAEGLHMAQFPVPRRQAGTDGTAACALSHAQERQCFLWRLEPLGTAYHMAETLRLQGALDEAAVCAAFGARTRLSTWRAGRCCAAFGAGRAGERGPAFDQWVEF